VVGNVFRQELKRNETMQARVFGLVNDAHPATTEFLDDAVVRDGLANHVERHLILLRDEMVGRYRNQVNAAPDDLDRVE
jgi:hypothetical protein